MKGFISSAAVAAVIFASSGVESFAPAPRRTASITSASSGSLAVHQHQHPTWSPTSTSNQLFASPKNDESPTDEDDATSSSSSSRRTQSQFLSNLRRKSKPIALAALTATTFLPNNQSSFLRPLPAKASAPIVLRAAKKKEDPPMVQAMKKAEEIKKARGLEEFDAFMAKCNDIEEAEGKAARDAYEKQYQADKDAADAQKQVDVTNLKRKLLDGGRDPHTDLNAERQVFLLEHDVDLEKISGTPHNEEMIKNFQRRGRKAKKTGGKKFADTEDAELTHQHYIIACQVSDLKARGIDPMEHFASQDVMDKTRAIYKMDDRVAEKVATQYKGLMEEYGGLRLTAPQEGEVAFVYEEAGGELLVEVVDSPEAVKEKRAADKAKRAVEKAALREASAEAKAAAKVERAAAKEARLAEKAAAKEAKLAEKAVGAAAALAAKEAASAASAATASTAVSIIADDDVVAATASGDVFATAGNSAITSIEEQKASPPKKQSTSASKSKAGAALSTVKAYATPKNVAAVVLAGGVINYGVNYYQENNGGAQAERERQLKLILGDDNDDDDDDEFDDDDDEDEYEQFTQKKPEPPKSKPKVGEDKPAPAPKADKPSPPPAPPVPAPKRKLGIFSKRNADARETDINKLISPKAQGPEFAKLLTQILTFGAPGRFPYVASWGDMPFDKFDLETAKAMLTESRGDADLADEQSAEIFASVVNCMIIGIVDLASAALKSKDKEDKVAVDAINVVMDFMDHAASLFDAVAEDVTIKPVTYGGSIKKKDLEQMFSVYAGSSMMSLDALAGGGTSQDRVDTLQLVFAITDKKAEGLMQKHMMKQMMNMMKDGGKGMEGMPGMEGMEDMMKAMGGEGGEGMEEMMKAMGGEGGEGMEEMMKAMGGAGGMGMPGMDGGEMSPEDLKQTLGLMKEMMDSGQISDEELVEVRSQFKEMYGSDISDLIKKASEEGAEGGMSEDEAELLDMFKRILGED